MNPLEHYPQVTPILPGDYEAVRLAAERDKHGPPLAPTHVVTLGGRIVGSVGINSLPLYTLWLDSTLMSPRNTVGVLNVVENTLRMEGREMVATIINQGSPFLPVASRLGYLPATTSTLFLKQL